MRIHFLVYLTYSFLIFPAYCQQERTPITIETDIYHYAQKIIANRDVLSITDFSGTNSQRAVIEFILIQQALELGGLKIDFYFVPGNYDARNIKLVQSGMLLINFDSMWLSYIDNLRDDLYISDPIIRKGEYWAGLYTAIDNERALDVKTLADLQKRSIVSSKNWHVDWKTLMELKPNALMHEEEWLSMAKLVSLQWVDIMLAPFTSSQPYSYQGDGYNIIAIDGIKLALNDSRHFVISKKHPQGKEAYTALQKGLKILRKRGTISKAFKQSGFFNELVQDWHIINAESITVKQ
jgi:hypothetical protein